MNYFTNVSSMKDLKKQYRDLARKNHPDTGGTTEVMQRINNEYGELMEIWKNKTEQTVQATNTKKSEFYTPYGWKGKNYNSELSTKDIAKAIREYVKQKWRNYKFSVTSEYYSMGSSIDVYLMEGPENVLINPEGSHESINQYYIDEDKKLTETGKAVFKDVIQFVDSYRYSDCDSMIDYFHVNFYVHYSIGKYDRPYKVKQKSAKATTSVNKDSIEIRVIDYSTKSYAVIGDTYQFKDQLKDIGVFNSNLTYKGKRVKGWIIAKSRLEQLFQIIGKTEIKTKAA